MLEALARDIRGDDPAEVALMIAALAAAALWLGWRAWRSLNHARVIADIPTARARSAPQGYVELEGRGRLMDGEPVIAPLSGLPCVWYRYKVEEQVSEHSGGRERARWHTVEQGTSDASFWLEDDTGRVAVDPEGAEVTPRHKDVWHTRSPLLAPSMPTAVGAFLAAHPSGNPHRFTEERINPGDPVYALGELRNLAAHADTLGTAGETRALLAEWKRDQPQLKRRFDLDGDGRLGEREWMLARAAARREVERARRERGRDTSEGVNLLSDPRDRTRPYLLSAHPQTKLIRRYTALALLTGAGFFAAGSAAVWIYNVRFG